MVSINLIIKPGRRAPEESLPPTHSQASFPSSAPKIKNKNKNKKNHDSLILQPDTLHKSKLVLSASNEPYPVSTIIVAGTSSEERSLPKAQFRL